MAEKQLASSLTLPLIDYVMLICYVWKIFISEKTIFGRSFSSEKCPTITVTSFFPSNQKLTLYVPLFVHYAILPKVLGT